MSTKPFPTGGPLTPRPPLPYTPPASGRGGDAARTARPPEARGWGSRDATEGASPPDSSVERDSSGRPPAPPRRGRRRPGPRRGSPRGSPPVSAGPRRRGGAPPKLHRGGVPRLLAPPATPPRRPAGGGGRPQSLSLRPPRPPLGGGRAAAHPRD